MTKKTNITLMKEYKWQLLLSSIVILFPMVAGLLMWNILPDTMVTHWGADTTADGFRSKPVAICLPPVFLLALHWFCIFVTTRDPKNKGQNTKVFFLILWIIPGISLFINAIMYTNALRGDVSIDILLHLGLGILFLLLGNYLPKCRQNHTIGIRLPWTLVNEENWNKTHRFAGKVWVIGGFIIMITVFLPTELFVYAFVAFTLILALIPTVYSYAYYRKQMSGRG